MSEIIKHQPSLPTVEPAQATTPARLIEVALQSGADVAQLEKLMDMQLRWEANEARKAFVTAMSAFRAEAPTIGKNKAGHNSNYASIDNITNTINPLLAKHGLSFGWVTEQGETITVHCDVTHVQGHSQRVSLSAGPDTSGSKNSIQAIGSTVSYLQRYTLLSALGLATGEHDNDGNSIPSPKSANAAQADPESPVIQTLTTAADQGKEALQNAWRSLKPSERNSVPAEVFRSLKKQVGW